MVPQERLSRLIYHLWRHCNWTQHEIARVMDCTPQNVFYYKREGERLVQAEEHSDITARAD